MNLDKLDLALILCALHTERASQDSTRQTHTAQSNATKAAEAAWHVDQLTGLIGRVQTALQAAAENDIAQSKDPRH